jgi:hypothetical protein
MGKSETKRDRTAPYSFQKIKGYPDKLQLYRIDASPSFQVRFYSEALKRYKRKSTGTAIEKEAIEFAKKFYDENTSAELNNIPLISTAFGSLAKQFLKKEEKLAERGRINRRKFTEEKKKLEKDIIPFFGRTEISEIQPKDFDRYLEEILYERDLSPSTINKHFVVINAVLKFAKLEGKIKYVPDIPNVKMEQKPRGYFKEEEYLRVRNRSLDLARQKYTHLLMLNGKAERVLYFTMELFDFIVFSTNVHVRLSDVKDLKHMHVSRIKHDGNDALEISPPKSKTRTKSDQRTSFSMPQAVRTYNRLVKRHVREGKGVEPDDYIFYPEYRNRQTALANLGRLFNHLLELENLKTDAFGTERTLYSLRHTALMFRFLYMDPSDIFLIARNALTSVEMLEKFYLSHADTRMKLAQLQSRKAS